MARTHSLSGLQGDVRYALRAIGREPGFFGVAILVVGLGVGACTAVFSVVSPLLMRPLPFQEPDQLVWISNGGDVDGGMSAVTSRTSNLRDFRELNKSFEGLTGYNAFFEQRGYNLSSGGSPERLMGVGVAHNFLDVLGVRPIHGRNFTEEEGLWGGPNAVILTHAFWMRRYAGDPSVIGTSISLNDEPAEVVGVLPSNFDFASTFAPTTNVDFLGTFAISDETDRWGNTLSMVGRLKPGITAANAQAELDVIVSGLQENDPDRWGLAAAVTDLKTHIAGPFRSAMLLLVAAAGAVMLIVCVNLSNLLLAKGPKRAREMAIRTALGATRARLFRQLLSESVVLSLGGGVVGVLIAYGVTMIVAQTSSISIPMLSSVAVDGSALAFTLVLATVAGLAVGVVPAWQVSEGGAGAALRVAGRGSSAGSRGTRLREVLVVAEVAIACGLLVSGGLLLKSFQAVLDVELGFQPAQAIAWQVNTSRTFESPVAETAFYDELVANVQAVPGVEDVGLTDALPLGRNRTWGVGGVGMTYENDQFPSAFPHIVDWRYIGAMRIPLQVGRLFNAMDTRDTYGVVILNETAARVIFQGQDPIGQHLTTGGRGEERQVVGVVADVRHQSPEKDAGSEMYFPFTQNGDFGGLEMIVRSSLPMVSLVGGIRQAITAIDPTMPTGDYQQMDAIVDRAVSPRRFMLALLAAFSGTALLLAGLGIYGVLSYSVTERIPEIGIRMALGESRQSIQRRVVGKTLTLACIGVIIGAALSFVGVRLIRSLLYQVDPADPGTFALMAMILLGVAAIAGYLPARRASRTDPTSAFRSV